MLFYILHIYYNVFCNNHLVVPFVFHLCAYGLFFFLVLSKHYTIITDEQQHRKKNYCFSSCVWYERSSSSSSRGCDDAWSWKKLNWKSLYPIIPFIVHCVMTQRERTRIIWLVAEPWAIISSTETVLKFTFNKTIFNVMEDFNDNFLAANMITKLR